MEDNNKNPSNDAAKSIAREQQRKERKMEKMRRDKEYNQAIISSAYSELLVEKKKLPSMKAIAEKCGINEKTVKRHLEDFDFEEYMIKFRAGSEMVMLNLFKQAATGNSEKMIRLYLESVGLLKRKLDITTNGKQINSTQKEGLITIDVSKLSETALLEILAAAGETT